MAKISRKGKYFITALRDLCFPPCCLGCGNEPLSSSFLLCLPCYEQLRFCRQPLCLGCGQMFLAGTGKDRLCGLCRQGRWQFCRARSLLVYENIGAEMIQALKYSRLTAGKATFSRLWAEKGPWHDLTEPDLVIAVPLHVSRLRQRGFNQALWLARLLFGRFQIKTDILHRVNATRPQTGLSGGQRRKNLKGAFMVNSFPWTGAKVLLVDDVYTTGTTANECARVLRRAGAGGVEVFTLARAHSP